MQVILECKQAPRNRHYAFVNGVSFAVGFLPGEGRQVGKLGPHSRGKAARTVPGNSSALTPGVTLRMKCNVRSLQAIAKEVGGRCPSRRSHI